MIFGKPKPTVTQDDKNWIEEAFLWLEQQYGSDFLKNVRTIEPTREFFPFEFNGKEESAEHATKIICDFMQIIDVKIDLHYFSDKPQELNEGIVTTQSNEIFYNENRNVLGTYTEEGINHYSIGIEQENLKNPINLISTLAHELSHLKLLGEGRLEENDEELTDLNTIALGFGIFTANSIFRFEQWQGISNQGWQANKSGYIPEQVATYALALLTNYQKIEKPSWAKYLNKSVRSMFDKNMLYLKKTNDNIKFK